MQAGSLTLVLFLVFLSGCFAIPSTTPDVFIPLLNTDGWTATDPGFSCSDCGFNDIGSETFEWVLPVKKSWEYALTQWKLGATYGGFEANRQYYIEFDFKQDSNNEYDYGISLENGINKFYFVVKTPYKMSTSIHGFWGSQLEDPLYVDAKFSIPKPYSSEWTTKSIPVLFPTDMAGGHLMFFLGFGGRPINQPAKYYIRNLRIKVPSHDYSSRNPTLLTPQTAAVLINIPRPSNPGVVTPSNCPYSQGGLVNWNLGTSGDITLPAGQKVLVSASSFTSTVINSITIPETSELIFKDEDIDLHVHNIIVHGKLTIGSESCPLQSSISITFYGAETTADEIGGFMGSKGIGVHPTGSMDLHGKRYFPTWSRLARTAYMGDDRVWLQESPNWEPGQKVILTTTIHWDDRGEASSQYEVLTVKEVDGNVVQFEEVLKYIHYGGPEYQAEVGLLSHNILLKGANDSDASEFGGHTICRGLCRISGVMAYKFGQKNHLARYPYHFHMIGNAPDNYVRASSIWKSFYRCVVVHGTHQTVVTENVAYDIQGHCYYLEDGVEEQNEVTFNLASAIHSIKTPSFNYWTSQPGFSANQAADLAQPADIASAGFYITNGQNRIVGNAAAGGFFGYSFPNLPRAIGLSSSSPVVPKSRTNLEFDGNTAHSNGNLWDLAGCIYIGGELKEDGSGNLFYTTGRTSRDTRDDADNQVWQRFTNTRVSLCSRGFNHWGDRAELINFESYDSRRGATLFGKSEFSNAIISGWTDNPNAYPHDKDHRARGFDAFQFYDTFTLTLFDSITFRNFGTHPRCGLWGSCSNHVFLNMAHSDKNKQQRLSLLRNIGYQDVERKVVIKHDGFNPDHADSGAAYQFSAEATDGSAWLESTPTILGSHTSWWKYSDQCCKDVDWGLWKCPKQDGYEVINMWITIPGVIQQYFGEDKRGDHGYVALFGPGISDKRAITLTGNAGPSGVAGPNVGWNLWFRDGAPERVSISPIQVASNVRFLLSIPYPKGTTFTKIEAKATWDSSAGGDLTLASSTTEVLNSDFKYFLDTTSSSQHDVLYIRPWNFKVGQQQEYFTRGLQSINTFYWNATNYNIFADFSSVCSNVNWLAGLKFCPIPEYIPGVSTYNESPDIMCSTPTETMLCTAQDFCDSPSGVISHANVLLPSIFLIVIVMFLTVVW